MSHTRDNLRPLIPGQPVPPLESSVVGQGQWRLIDQNPAKFSLVVFYRGFHCPICSSYLIDLQRHLGTLSKKGVETIALSSDGEERARMAVDRWGLDTLRIGYGLTLASAREWGLFILARRGPNPTPTGVVEPPLFSEPGLFLVRPDETL